MKLHYTNQTLITAVLLFFTASLATAQNTRQLHIVETGDVHGAWFDEPYVEGGRTRASLMSVKVYVDSLRSAVGADNVLLIDAGDCLQGDNAAYYFNNIADKNLPHPFPRIAKAIGYDAMAIGNHDIETGHEVYDKVAAELQELGIPWLGGNVIRESDGGTYFPLYKIVKKAGLNVAVIGFENPNIQEWLPEKLFSGMAFLSLVPFAQSLIDFVIDKEHPDIVVVVAHSGTGDGYPNQLESQALYLFNTLKGVDVLVGGHDHEAVVLSRQGLVYLDSGARANRIGHAVVDIHMAGKKIISKDVSGEIVVVDKNKVDENLKAQFREEFEAVKAFTNRKVGYLEDTLRSRDSYIGNSAFVSLIQSVQLGVSEAQISFAAPLLYNATVNAGTLIYNDMFSIYPYENELYVVKLKGSEVKAALEYSYNNWIQLPENHVLRIARNSETRNGVESWSFEMPPYNFDSAAGLFYTVDVTKPYGSRVSITTLADGTPFDLDAYYNVAMSSYRASGGGGSLTEGAGLDPSYIDELVIAKYPAVRDMIYDYVANHEVITKEMVTDPKVVGGWKFVPEKVVEPLLDRDMKLLFN